jgi:uncharacterized protein YgiM (DUF1202 family)/uncharacterized protein YcbK (DUF882 family)/GH24 family phage-related lysozyme (muramidase)
MASGDTTNVAQLQAAPPAAENAGGVPQAVIDHLKLREGVRYDVYLDTRGFPTAGVGHLLTAAERRSMPVGSRVSRQQVDTWLAQDSRTAYSAAQSQASQLGVGSQDFINALASVNFQLGTAWNTEHRMTWRYMTQHKWEEAAVEAADSSWFAQTPVRVRDFQAALRALAGTSRNPSAPTTGDSSAVSASDNGNGNTRPTANGEVTGNDVNVRTGPGSNFRAVSQKDAGAQVQVFETKNGWLRIAAGQWIKAEFVRQSATSSNSNAPAPGGDSSAPPANRPGTITGDNVNIRSGPGTNNRAIGQLDKGATVTVLESRNGWVRIGDNRWVSAQYVRTTSGSSNASTTRGTITGDKVNVRSGPGTSNRTVGTQLDRGASVTILERRDGWVRIGEGRWVFGAYVQAAGTQTNTPAPPSNTGTNRPNTPAPSAESESRTPPVTSRQPVTISGSVGAGGANRRADALKIQQLLKDLGFRIGVDGGIGKNTIGAIAAFQQAQGMSNDGRVDPGGRTLQLMNGSQNGSFRNTAQNLQQDDNAPRLTNTRWTNRSHLTTDTSGEVIPRQFYANMRKLIQQMDAIASNLRGNFTVGSGYRSPHYNSTLEGSAAQSNHQFGKAVDIYSDTYSPSQLRAELRRLINEGKIHAGGIGLYSWGCHYDIDSRREW